MFDRAIAADPQSFAARGERIAVAIAWKGDVTFAENQLLVGPSWSSIRMGLLRQRGLWVLMLQRKFPEALASGAASSRGETLSITQSSALAQRLSSKERFIFIRAIRPGRMQRSSRRRRCGGASCCATRPKILRRHAHHRRLCLLALGRKEDAIAEGKQRGRIAAGISGRLRWAAMLPLRSRKFTLGPANRMTPFGFSIICSWSQQCPNCRRHLKLHSDWDPLRKDPRFQALIDEHARKH